MTSGLPYLGILVAAAVEGEVAYVAACALVASGLLSPLGVILAGATGAALGDQAYFYVARGRLNRWMARFPALERKAAALVAAARRRQTLVVLLIRFAPGFRVALTLACAYAEVPALTFSLLNAASALVWASVLLVLVAWVGPAGLEQFGLNGWKAALVTGAGIVLLIKLFGRYEKTLTVQ
jgi:membrane-associated protein